MRACIVAIGQKLDVLAALRFVRGARGATVSATASSVAVSRDQIRGLVLSQMREAIARITGKVG